MTKIEGRAFVELDNLKVLDLSYNQLTGNWTLELNLTLLKVLIGTSNIIQLFCDALSTKKEYMLSTERFKEKDSREF
jgi:Leucine-rich repeat (LRR) protein